MIRQLEREATQRSDFSDWLRDEDLHGMQTVRIYDADWMIYQKENFETLEGRIMILEEKCMNGLMSHDQAAAYLQIDKGMKIGNPYYWSGFHYLRFEKTTPENGAIFIDENWISKADFIKFLEFKMPDSIYVSWFDKLAADGINWRQRVLIRNKVE